MTSEFKNISKKAHMAPATMIHVGDNSDDSIFSYRKFNEDRVFRKDLNNLEEFYREFETDREHTKWLDIIGLKNTKAITDLGKELEIHPLIIEDILNTSQHPKFENYGRYLVIVAKDIFFNEDDEIDSNQISFLLFEDTIISFQEEETDIFNSPLTRLKEGTNIRKNSADYLLYTLMDSIVDNYFLLLEDLGDRIDLIEDELLAKPYKELLEKIYKLKRDLIYIRNSLWPMRNIITGITWNDHNLIKDETIYYFRDIYDHTIQLIDLTETSRDICSGMLDTYLSSLGNKTNDVMKILTIFSTISVPLTFLTGLYGMNFAYFPELQWKYSYFIFWILVFGIIFAMIKYFKKKGWL